MRAEIFVYGKGGILTQFENLQKATRKKRIYKNTHLRVYIHTHTLHFTVDKGAIKSIFIQVTWSFFCLFSLISMHMLKCQAIYCVGLFDTHTHFIGLHV